MKPLTILLAALLCCLAARATAQVDKPPFEADKEWSGSVADEKLQAAAPAVIKDAKAFETLWKAWKPNEKIPEVDFKTNLVLVQTTRGSVLRVNLLLDNKSDLKIVGLATRDLRPGFRFVLLSVKKEGIKTIDGKPVE